jgi:hypothetical protein
MSNTAKEEVNKILNEKKTVKDTQNELLDIILECKSVLSSINDNCISYKEIDQSMNSIRQLTNAVQISSKKWLAKQPKDSNID